MLINQVNAFSSEQPSLRFVGNTAYKIENERIIISFDAIENQRVAGNISGTVSIELWALNAPVTGVEFEGYQVAATQIGEILGQHILPDCRYDLIFNQPPVGSWYLALMLREWDGISFITRDIRSFDLPYQVELHLVENSKQSSTEVINIHTRSAVVSTHEKAKKDIVKKSDKKSVKPKASKKNALAKKTEKNKKASSVKAPKAKTLQTKASPNKVSINLASAQELTELKGISKKLAKAIIEGRPYKSVKSLLTIKGIGPKVFEKIRKGVKC